MKTTDATTPEIQVGVRPKFKDLLDYAEQNWLQTRRLDAENITVKAFIESARKLFATNLPVGIDHTSAVMALRMQDGTVIPLCEAASNEMEGISGFQPISVTGKTNVAPTQSWDMATKR